MNLLVIYGLLLVCTNFNAIATIITYCRGFQFSVKVSCLQIKDLC